MPPAFRTQRRQQGEARRLRHVWPFLGWTALSAHVDFWDRTGRRVALRHPSLAAFIVPSHDYQTGARLVSIADRSPCERFEELLDRFQRAFVDTVESTRPELRGGISDALFFSAAVEPLGLDRARPPLEGLLGGPRGPAAEVFLAKVRAEGFSPRAVHFAVRRYRRWLAVNPGATPEACGPTLAELWGTYRLAELEADWPDVRVRFFRQTAFAGAREELGVALDRLMEAARGLPAGALNLEEQIAPIREAGVTGSDQRDTVAHEDVSK